MAEPLWTVPDHEVARVVAREPEDALARREREEAGPYYAASLWVDEVYGYFAFNTADQGDYQRRTLGWRPPLCRPWARRVGTVSPSSVALIDEVQGRNDIVWSAA